MMSEEIELKIVRLFNDIHYEALGEYDECECNESDEVSFAERLYHSHEIHSALPSLIEKVKTESVNEIYETNLLWLDSDLKPQIIKDELITNEKWLEFEEKRNDLNVILQEKHDKEEKLKEEWISEKGLVPIKCSKCGDNNEWYYTTNHPTDCICNFCLDKEYEEKIV